MSGRIAAARGSLRAGALIVAALIGCQLAAALGIAITNAALAPPDTPHRAPMRAAIHVFQPTDGPTEEPDFPYVFLTRAWVHWDSQWYASIARDGYWYVPGEQSPVAFFPTYPLLVRALSALGLNRFFAGVLLTMLSGTLGLFLFHRWAAELRGEATALRATALFVVYPYAFYLFGAMYSDALYLCLAVGAFYALERNRLVLMVLLGAAAAGARPIAPALVLGLLARRMELRRQAGERLRPGDLAPALAGLGLAAYVAFCWSRFGDPLAFAHAEAAPGWDNLAGPRSYLKIPFFEMFACAPADSGTYLHLLHAGISLAVLSCAVPLWRRVSRGYAVYVAAAIGIPLFSSKDFMGLGRYAMAAFPVFLMLSLLLAPRPRLTRAVLAACAALLVFFTMLFAADNFVA